MCAPKVLHPFSVQNWRAENLYVLGVSCSLTMPYITSDLPCLLCDHTTQYIAQLAFCAGRV